MLAVRKIGHLCHGIRDVHHSEGGVPPESKVMIGVRIDLFSAAPGWLEAITVVFAKQVGKYMDHLMFVPHYAYLSQPSVH